MSGYSKWSNFSGRLDPEASTDLERTENHEPWRQHTRLVATSTLNLTGCLGKKGNPTEHGLDRRKPRILNRGLRRGQKSERFHGWTWSSGARKIRGVSAPCLSKRCLSMWVVKYLTEKTSIFVTSVICIWFVLRGQVVLRNNVGSLCRFRCFADS